MFVFFFTTSDGSLTDTRFHDSATVQDVILRLSRVCFSEVFVGTLRTGTDPTGWIIPSN